MTRSTTPTMRVLAPLVSILAVQLAAQQPEASPSGPGATAQRFAPIDLTGTWVSVVTEDWVQRMLTPAKGDFESLPLTRAAQDAANRADMAQVAAAGRACEAYGAPVVMRQPGRVRIGWQGADTLRIEADAGQQTRLLRFGGSGTPAGPPTLQGTSRAEWQYANGFDPVRALNAGPPGGRGRGGAARGAPPVAPMGGRLKVTTTNLRAGFLRRNGVPYSSNTVLTEYFNLLTEPSGIQWFVVTTIVHDPANLVVDYVTSTNFRKEPNDSKWSPRPCAF